MIYGITDRTLYKNKAVYLNQIDSFLASPKVDYLMLRDKALNVLEYERLLETVIHRNPNFKHKLIVHTHILLAYKHNIYRIHMPEAYLYNEAFRAEVHRINALSSEPMTISYAYHPNNDLSETNHPNLSEADYLMVSPVCETTCKPGDMPITDNQLKSLKASFGDKLILLGGLGASEIESYKDLGYKHFALRSQLIQYL